MDACKLCVGNPGVREEGKDAMGRRGVFFLGFDAGGQRFRHCEKWLSESNGT